MKIKVTGTNYWGRYKTYLHVSLQQQPTPMFAHTILGIQINSQMCFNKFNEVKEVELKEGDYVMLITKKDWKEFGKQTFGHMHYFDGKKLISVYTKKEYKEMENVENNNWKKWFTK